MTKGDLPIPLSVGREETEVKDIHSLASDLSIRELEKFVKVPHDFFFKLSNEDLSDTLTLDSKTEIFMTAVEVQQAQVAHLSRYLRRTTIDAREDMLNEEYEEV